MKIENENYFLSIDTVKNMYHVKIKPANMNLERMKSFVNDQMKLLEKLRSDMLVLSDMSEAPMIPKEAIKELQGVQEYALKIGVKKDARVVSKSELANIAFGTTDKASGLKDSLKYFDSILEAEKWLFE
ncbi:MAG: hypothetical protein SFU98_07990 [Leptospiraceae bacterium]|nr:hypothetical protein [Leptospiraceae bacterium]